MTEWDLQEGWSGPRAHYVVLHNNARIAAVDGATEAEPVDCADLHQTSRATRALFAASIYTMERCKPQLLSHRDLRNLCAAAHTGDVLNGGTHRPPRSIRLG